MKIIKKYGANFSQTIAINGIINPDLIIPGHKIKLQADGSVWVMKKKKPVTGILPFNYTPAKTIAHVSLPDKDDPFAPENPSVSYEVKPSVLKPVQQTVKETLVFKTFEKFVRGFPQASDIQPI